LATFSAAGDRPAGRRRGDSPVQPADIWTATTRFPWFGVAAVFVVFLPALNGCISDRIDNHDVRMVEGGKPVPARWTSTKPCRPGSTSVAREPGEGSPALHRRRYGGRREPRRLLDGAGPGRSGAPGPAVRDSIFAISSVSGGSVGAVLMRALIDLDRVQEAELGWKNPDDRVVCDSGEAAPQPYLSCLRVFMRRDFLAAAFSGMFFTDLMQRVWPAAWGRFPDRAETLERSWEASWDEMIASLKAPKGADPRAPEKPAAEGRQACSAGVLPAPGARARKPSAAARRSSRGRSCC
jgi:hypothetical protein